MKISLITPLFNEEKNIKRYFDAIRKIDFPKDKLEIVLVNDGSTDESKKSLETECKNTDFPTKIVNLSKNQGIANAVDTGVKNAKHKNIVLLGIKNEIFPDALKQFEKLNYKVIIGIPIQKDSHKFDRFFLSVKTRIHRNSFHHAQKEIFLTKDNFEKTPKGTTIFFCEKKLFLESQITNKNSRHSSDDTKLLWNIVQKTDIMISGKPKCYYNTRNSFKENAIHIFNRGPKFIDHYYKITNIMFYLINLTILLLFIGLPIAIYKGILMEVLLFLLLANTIIAIFITEKIREFPTNFIFFPTFILIFFAGIIRGLILKLSERNA